MPGQVATKNNPYSPSPSSVRIKQNESSASLPVSDPREVAFVAERGAETVKQQRPTVAQQTFNIAKSADRRALQPTETYRIGVGDVLFVDLKNSPQASGYYTVRPNGSIDFPLAGDNVLVSDQTIDEIEESIASRITLFQDPQIEVKVREYASHSITVSGMVDNPGKKSLQREAIPLFVIKAEAGVSPQAAKALITRAPLQKPELYDLRDPKTENILIYPGNNIEFTASGSQDFYFIGGDINSVGQKNYIAGLTLFQAILASGGEKGNPKKAIIRRKNEKGTLSVIEHNVRAIKSGKAPDPILQPGDMIEIND